jgi:hypothetical protein
MNLGEIPRPAILHDCPVISTFTMYDLTTEISHNLRASYGTVEESCFEVCLLRDFAFIESIFSTRITEIPKLFSLTWIKTRQSY